MKRILFVFCLFVMFSQLLFSQENNVFIGEIIRESFPNETAEKYYSEKYVAKNTLNIEDCKDIEFIKYIFTAESGINIKDKKVEIIENKYLGGIPVQIEELPIYYKILISNKEYEHFKKVLGKNDNWECFKNTITFRLITKFDCSCKITEKEIIFGFRKMKGIQP